MKNNEELELGGLAQSALEAARRAGAEAAQVHLSRARFADVNFRDDALERATASTKQSLSLRLFVDGRFGVHSTSDPRPASLASFVEEATQLTRLLEPDPLRGLPEPRRLAQPPAPELGLLDPELAASQAPLWLERARDMEKLIRQTAAPLGGLVSASGGAFLESSLEVLANSLGFMGAQAEAACMISASATFLDPQQQAKRRMGYWLRAGRSLGELDGQGQNPAAVQAVAQAVADEALRRARRLMGARPGPSGRYAVLVENTTAGRLVGDLLSCLSGASLHQKRSFLAGRQGQIIASPLLTLRDEPLLPGGYGSRWFDGEGVAAQTLPLVEAGVLMNYYLDTYYARQLGLPPTTGGSSNLTLASSQPGGFETMLAKMERGLAITGFLGGNFNSTTGDFSYGVQGLWVEKGQVAHAVEGMNMAGNFTQLWEGLERVGDDPYPYAKLRAPSLLFREAQLGGASLAETGATQ